MVEIQKDFEGMASREEVVISCDWMALSCRLGRLHNTDKFDLPTGWTALKMGQTAVWAQRWYFMDDRGEKVATFLCEPRSGKIAGDRALVEMSNRYLYNIDYERVVASVLSVWPIDVTGVNRVDLCGDFEMTKERWQVVRALESGEATLKGVHANNLWREKNGNVHRPHQLAWGGKESTIKWKLYNKYKELHEGGLECSKPYIEEMWSSLGYSVRDMWRLEVSLHGCNSLVGVETDKPYPWQQWYRDKEKLFASLYGSKFQVRLQLGYCNNRYNPILHFLDLEGKKILKCRGVYDNDRESDCERRVVCKMWAEFVDAEVGCNRDLYEDIRRFLVDRMQERRCIMYVCKRYGLTEDEVVQRVSLPFGHAQSWLDA